MISKNNHRSDSKARSLVSPAARRALSPPALNSAKTELLKVLKSIGENVDYAQSLSKAATDLRASDFAKLIQPIIDTVLDYGVIDSEPNRIIGELGDGRLIRVRIELFGQSEMRPRSFQ